MGEVEKRSLSNVVTGTDFWLTMSETQPEPESPPVEVRARQSLCISPFISISLSDETHPDVRAMDAS